MNREQAKLYIKDQLEDYLKRKGINTARPFNCLNPEHQDKNPSMSYDSKRNKAHCFSCGADYDTFDIIGIDYRLTDPADIFDKAYSLYRVKLQKMEMENPGGIPPTPKTQEVKDYTEYITQAHKKVDKTDYLTKRGISQATIDRFNLGYDPEFKTINKGGEYVTWKAVIIPTGQHSFIARNTDWKAEHKERYRKRGPSLILNPEALQSGKPVFIVEGELDALSLVEVGVEAVALGSADNADQFIKHLKKNPPAGGLILSLDNDETGIKTTEKLEQELKALQIPFIKADIAEPYNDPNEALTQDRGAFTQTVQEAQKALATQEEAEQEAEREEYRRTSTAYYIQDFINGITDSVNTPFIPTGFNQLDKVLDGGLYEGLYILGAISSLGKTTFIMQIADHIATSGNDVLVFSLEMARTELMAKSISRLTFIGSEKPTHAKTTRGITTGKRYEIYSQPEHDLITKSIQAYGEYARHIYISEGMGDIGADQIRGTIAKHTRLTGKRPVVIVDYLQLLAPHNERATDKQNTDKAVMELKRISRDYKIPVLAVSSFNRQSYSQPVSMESFKESGAIEYSSDVLIGLQATGAGEKGFDVNEAKNKDPRQVELRLLKNRNGATGKTIYYDYYPLFNYFAESQTQAGSYSGW